jgi:hypothetical protein
MDNWNYKIDILKACLGISVMKGDEGHWGGGISIISQNFPKSPSNLFYPLESSISQTSPNTALEHELSVHSTSVHMYMVVQQLFPYFQPNIFLEGTCIDLSVLHQHVYKQDLKEK